MSQLRQATMRRAMLQLVSGGVPTAGEPRPQLAAALISYVGTVMIDAHSYFSASRPPASWARAYKQHGNFSSGMKT